MLVVAGGASPSRAGRRLRPRRDGVARLRAGLRGAPAVLLATDLDQRLLPDLLTLPLIVFAAAVLLLGYSPALAGKELGLVSGVAAAVVLPVVMLVLDRVIGGDLGFGDVKLSVSLGLLFGLSAPDLRPARREHRLCDRSCRA